MICFMFVVWLCMISILFVYDLSMIVAWSCMIVIWFATDLCMILYVVWLIVFDAWMISVWLYNDFVTSTTIITTRRRREGPRGRRARRPWGRTWSSARHRSPSWPLLCFLHGFHTGFIHRFRHRFIKNTHNRKRIWRHNRIRIDSLWILYQSYINPEWILYESPSWSSARRGVVCCFSIKCVWLMFCFLNVYLI